MLKKEYKHDDYQPHISHWIGLSCTQTLVLHSNLLVPYRVVSFEHKPNELEYICNKLVP